MEKWLSRNWLCGALIGLFTLLLWGQTARYEFVWDDALYISDNKAIRSLTNIPKFFYRMDTQSAVGPYVSYRPLRNTVYAVIDALEGRSGQKPLPWLFHLVNILWHAVVAILLFLTMLALWRRHSGSIPSAVRMAALLAALGFAAQPVNSEVVCWAKSLDDLMAASFVLAAMRSLLKWNGHGPDYALAVTWFLLAAFAKESALPFAAAAFFILYGFHRLPFYRCVKYTIPFFLVALLNAACRQWVMGRSSQCAPLSGSYGQTLLDMFPVVTEYLRLLLGIPPFCIDYNYMVAEPPHSFLSFGVLGGLFLALLGLALAVRLWRFPQWRISAFGLIWFALFMLPVSNLVPMMQYMADRFLYLPMMGFLLAVAGAVLNFPRQKLLAALGISTLIIVWTITSLARMTIWHDELTLFLRTELEHPGIRRVEKNALAAIFRLPQIQVWQTAKNLTPLQANQMIDTLEQAQRIFPQNDLLTTQLGMTEARMEHWPRAVDWLELATRQNPDSAERWYDLASIYRLAGNSPKAREAVLHSLRLNPNYREARRLQEKLARETKSAG